MEAVQIKSILEDELINLTLHAKNKDEVIQSLVSMMYNAGHIKSIEGFTNDVYLREKEGITGMGNNVAIPHGKSADVTEACVAIGRTKDLIEWESYDNQPSRLFFLFAVPNGKEGANQHLKLLSQLATKLADDEILEKLKQSKTIEEFKNYLA